MGILQIKNLSNGKILITSSKNLPGKLNSIKFQLDMKIFNFSSEFLIY